LETTLRSAERTVVIGPGRPFVIVGERINPSGRPDLAEELRRGEYATVCGEAIAQVQAGARVLDLNVGASRVDEVRVLPEVVAAVQEVVDVPLCIDSAMSAALEAALDACEGKPLVNSVTAEEEGLERILPLVRDRGAAVVGLAHGGEGITSDPHDRLEAARRIVERAAQLGIGAEDVVIDPLVMSVGVDSQAGAVALETMRLVRHELGTNIVSGISNVSHGLPDRDELGAAFLAMAMHAGLTCGIANPLAPQLLRMVRAAEVVLGVDRFAKAWIRLYREANPGSGGGD
jgi:5-methyltetrahydrofolate--homocysteine methyltransferase